MLSALEEAPFVLQGPKPLIPPPAWEAYWLPGELELRRRRRLRAALAEEAADGVDREDGEADGERAR